MLLKYANFVKIQPIAPNKRVRPKASLGEIAWFVLALGFNYFHVFGYTPINALNVLVNIMKSDVNSKTFPTVFTPLKNLHIHSA